jgi:DNA-binding LacI/PurR family transcriptional regulator
MFRSAPDQRPDALIIADDNLVDHACAGLMQLGLRVPDDVDVVAHANFPLSGNAILPVTRLGFDVPAILRTCLAVIARRHEGLEVPPLTVIPPLFTWELPQPAEAAPTLALPIGERIP